MKTKRLAVCILLSAALICGCGSRTEVKEPAPAAVPTEAPTGTPVPTAAPTDTPAPTAIPTPLTLRNDGLFVLTDPKGFQHPGESWITEDDGTVTCGPTDIYDAEFAFALGCSRWTISGKTCKPVMP